MPSPHIPLAKNTLINPKRHLILNSIFVSRISRGRPGIGPVSVGAVEPRSEAVVPGSEVARRPKGEHVNHLRVTVVTTSTSEATADAERSGRGL